MGHVALVGFDENRSSACTHIATDKGLFDLGVETKVTAGVTRCFEYPPDTESITFLKITLDRHNTTATGTPCAQSRSRTRPKIFVGCSTGKNGDLEAFSQPLSSA